LASIAGWIGGLAALAASGYLSVSLWQQNESYMRLVSANPCPPASFGSPQRIEHIMALFSAAQNQATSTFYAVLVVAAAGTLLLVAMLLLGWPRRARESAGTTGGTKLAGTSA
jgi:hypothetical protein